MAIIVALSSADAPSVAAAIISRGASGIRICFSISRTFAPSGHLWAKRWPAVVMLSSSTSPSIRRGRVLVKLDSASASALGETPSGKWPRW